MTKLTNRPQDRHIAAAFLRRVCGLAGDRRGTTLIRYSSLALLMAIAAVALLGDRPA